MSLRITNTLTRKVEDFVPRNTGKVDMFVCGPTVFDLIHIGNARTFVFFDVVAKWLRAKGLIVRYVQNITDIEDKIIARARECEQEPLQYAREFEMKFLEDTRAIGNSAVSEYARATDYIPQVIAQVKTLIKNGNVYLIDSDGWYFDLTTFPEYGKLSGRTALATNDAVSRIDDSLKKRNTGDFCVWKLSKIGEPSWSNSELGAGRPGWHIEDTAITEKIFGPQYDLHGGGIDLIFPHHEAEIAQQESASGLKPLVKYWMHGGFLEEHGDKMSKSLGNFATVRDMLQKYSPESIRFYLLSGYYHSPLAFKEDSIRSAEAAVQRLSELSMKLEHISVSPNESEEPSENIKNIIQKFSDAMDDDFNIPNALASLFDGVRIINTAIDSENISTQTLGSAKELLSLAKDTLGIVPTKWIAIPSDVQYLVNQRELARKQKDFSSADDFREKIIKMGYAVDDTPYGTLAKKK